MNTTIEQLIIESHKILIDEYIEKFINNDTTQNINKIHNLLNHYNNIIENDEQQYFVNIVIVLRNYLTQRMFYLSTLGFRL